jgi:hypothetical protein
MSKEQIDEALWRRARELATSAEGLEIIGLGRLRGGRLEAESPASSRIDAPRLVVLVAGELGIDDAAVRARLATAVEQALASAVGRPAPLGTLGLVEIRDGDRRFHPSRRTAPAPADAVETALTAWRTPANSVDDRVTALVAALRTIDGRLSVADQRRLLDELDYDLDDGEWQRFGDQIVATLPF